MIDTEAFDALAEHWAVRAVGDDSPRALRLAARWHAARALEGIMRIDIRVGPEEIALVDRVALAYEVAAAAGLSRLANTFVPTHDQSDLDVSQAGAYRAFELRRVLPLPEQESERIFHVLHLLGLAYAGDRWTDGQRWLNEQDGRLDTDADPGTRWDERVVRTLYRAWIALLRKEGWEDLAAIQDAVASLREEQQRFEPLLLDEDDPLERRAAAIRLIALYNWARATEVIGVYLATGEVIGADGPVNTVLDQHFDAATEAAGVAGDAMLETLLRWLHVAAQRMAAGSLWSAPVRDNPRAAELIRHLTQTRNMIELLPPQRSALTTGGLLDQAARAVVVDLPTSGGKTALAEFRILQALQFTSAQRAWVAYVAPTRALVAQITRRLRSDLGPLGVGVEALSAAVDVDALEAELLASGPDRPGFDVLVLTPEKLDQVIRNNRAARPLSLAVVDEAHNLEDEQRGMSLELLLATIKRDSPETRFLLLMPYVPNAEDLARWLAAPQGGRSISLGTSPWQPNERIVGMFRAAAELSGKAGDWRLQFESLTTTQPSVDLHGTYDVGPVRPLGARVPRSSVTSTKATGAMAELMSERGTSIAVARTIPDAWSMARQVRDVLPVLDDPHPDISLVQRFLATEVDPTFELIDMLAHGVGVHHRGLSDEIRALMEYLAEDNRLRVLCATTGIAQGINFPVSSVFLASRSLPGRSATESRDMSTRDFWNLAGRAGRIGHDSVGVIGLAETTKPNEVRKFVSDATGDLASRLETLLQDLYDRGRLENLDRVVYSDDWKPFRSYVAHLWAQKKSLDAVIAESDNLLRNTFGYSALRASDDPAKQQQAVALREATVAYARNLGEHPERAVLADTTGFSPEGVGRALGELGQLPRMTMADWQPTSLFGEGGQLASLVGVMLRLDELQQLNDLAGKGTDRRTIAEIATDWVDGVPIAQIAREYFAKGDSPAQLTQAISSACRGVYGVLAYAGTWGLSALSHLSPGIRWDQLDDQQKRQISLLPAMLYHGVATEDAVLMRMNSVPRSVASTLGERFRDEAASGAPSGGEVGEAREFLRALPLERWRESAPPGAMSGDDYRRLWRRLSGEIAA